MSLSNKVVAIAVFIVVIVVLAISWWYLTQMAAKIPGIPGWDKKDDEKDIQLHNAHTYATWASVVAIVTAVAVVIIIIVIFVFAPEFFLRTLPLFTFLLTALLLATGILASMASYELRKSSSYDSENNKATSAYHDGIIAAIISIVAVAGPIVVLIVFQVYKSHQKKAAIKKKDEKDASFAEAVVGSLTKAKPIESPVSETFSTILPISQTD